MLYDDDYKFYEYHDDDDYCMFYHYHYDDDVLSLYIYIYVIMFFCDDDVFS